MNLITNDTCSSNNEDCNCDTFDTDFDDDSNAFFCEKCRISYGILMARRAIPIIAFHRVESTCIYIYIFFLMSLARLCVVYVVKESRHFRGPVN